MVDLHTLIDEDAIQVNRAGRSSACELEIFRWRRVQISVIRAELDQNRGMGAWQAGRLRALVGVPTYHDYLTQDNQQLTT